MHLDVGDRIDQAWDAFRSDSSSTYQIHELRHTIEFAWFHPQTGEFMVAAEYNIRDGICVRLVYNGNEELAINDQ